MCGVCTRSGGKKTIFSEADARLRRAQQSSLVGDQFFWFQARSAAYNLDCGRTVSGSNASRPAQVPVVGRLILRIGQLPKVCEWEEEFDEDKN
jgi:hypothetical protein